MCSVRDSAVMLRLFTEVCKMDRQELLAFISKIIAAGEGRTVECSLKELVYILEREEEDESIVQLAKDTAEAWLEAYELGKKKRGAEVTEDEIGRVIREGRERKRRQEAFRC